jgi:hypothetical protein
VTSPRLFKVLGANMQAIHGGSADWYPPKGRAWQGARLLDYLEGTV